VKPGHFGRSARAMAMTVSRFGAFNPRSISSMRTNRAFSTHVSLLSQANFLILRIKTLDPLIKQVDLADQTG
jgi:hypothetical protein